MLRASNMTLPSWGRAVLSRTLGRQSELRPKQAARLDSSNLVGILEALERELPRLAHDQAIEVSFQDVAAEELLFIAYRYFGSRLAAADVTYRSPNDAWIHFDFTRDRLRTILLENAAARLACGGYFLLLTAPPIAARGGHEALRFMRSIELTTIDGPSLQALVWERL